MYVLVPGLSEGVLKALYGHIPIVAPTRDFQSTNKAVFFFAFFRVFIKLGSRLNQ